MQQLSTDVLVLLELPTQQYFDHDYITTSSLSSQELIHMS